VIHGINEILSVINPLHIYAMEPTRQADADNKNVLSNLYIPSPAIKI
jgi:hypothetical protein